MEIHNILKKHFDEKENFNTLPKSVKLAYHEIDIYEKKKISDLVVKTLMEEKIKTLSVMEKKEEIKKEFIKFKGNVNNVYGFFAYISVVKKWELSEIITSEKLYLKPTDENIFIYLINYMLKNTRIDGSDNHNLLALFKNYILNNDFEMLKYIFDRGERIFNEDFNKKKRGGEFIIKSNDEYYILNPNSAKDPFNIDTLEVKKLKPIIFNNMVFYHTNYFEKDVKIFNIMGELYISKELKKIRIQIFDNLFIVF